MLLQRPINMRELGLGNILTREETSYMRDMATHHFENVMRVLKSLPRPMLLVFRNVNTVRSINITLGAPVDRYSVMAKRSASVVLPSTGPEALGSCGSFGSMAPSQT